MANPTKNINSNNEKRQSTIFNDRMSDIGKILTRQAELKGTQDSAITKRMGEIFDTFAEQIKNDEGIGIKDSSLEQLDAFNDLKKIIVDMRKDNGENLKEYRSQINKLIGKVSTMVGDSEVRKRITGLGKGVLSGLDPTIKPRGEKFKDTLSKKLGMKDFSIKSFFNYRDTFEKDSLLGQFFNTPEDPKKQDEIDRLEGELEGMTTTVIPPNPRKNGSRSKPDMRNVKARRQTKSSFVGAAEGRPEENQFNYPWGPTVAQEGSGQVSPKSQPTPIDPLKLSTLNVDKVIAKSLDVDKSAKRTTQPRDEKGRFVSGSGVAKVSADTGKILLDINRNLDEINENTKGSGGKKGGIDLDITKNLLSKLAGLLGGAGVIGTAGTIAAGGALASYGATGVLASESQASNRKALTSNSMLGAMSGDTAIASAILDANGPDTAEKVKERQATEKESLKDAPWYTRMYGIGKQDYLKKQGKSQDEIDEMTGTNSLADLKQKKEEMETSLGSRKWMDKDDQKKYDELTSRIEGKEKRNVEGKDSFINQAPDKIKRDEAEISAKESEKKQAPIVIQSPAAPAAPVQPSIVMPIKGNVRPNESALEKMQSRTFTR